MAEAVAENHDSKLGALVLAHSSILQLKVFSPLCGRDGLDEATACTFPWDQV